MSWFDCMQNSEQTTDRPNEAEWIKSNIKKTSEYCWFHGKTAAFSVCCRLLSTSPKSAFAKWPKCKYGRYFIVYTFFYCSLLLPPALSPSRSFGVLLSFVVCGAGCRGGCKMFVTVKTVCILTGLFRKCTFGFLTHFALALTTFNTERITDPIHIKHVTALPKSTATAAAAARMRNR